MRAETTSGRTVCEYEGTDPEVAADCTADLVAETDPRSVWVCQREQIRSWWGEDVADLLERRLTSVTRRIDARLVVWSKKDEAVDDRYDVVFDR